MKILITIAFTALMFAAPRLAAHEPCMLNLSQLTQETIDEFCAGTLNEVVIECSEGTSIPMELFLNGDFFSLESPCSATVRILRTLFLRIDGTEFLFSLDLHEWKSFDALTTGRLGLILRVENQQPHLRIETELNQRKAF